MRSVLRYGLRFLLVIAAVSLVSTLLSPPSSNGGPYRSVLGDLAVSSAHAQPNCPNKGCPINPAGNCSHKAGFAGCALINGVCDDRMCIN